jgi:hypothetical protein
MDKLVKDNETINSEYENQTILVNQANGSLRFWTVIACIFFIIVLNQFRGKRATVASIFWLLIMISLIVLSFSISEFQDLQYGQSSNINHYSYENGYYTES